MLGDWEFNVSVVIDFHSARTRAEVDEAHESLPLHEESGRPWAVSSLVSPEHTQSPLNILTVKISKAKVRRMKSRIPQPMRYPFLDLGCDHVGTTCEMSSKRASRRKSIPVSLFSSVGCVGHGKS